MLVSDVIKNLEYGELSNHGMFMTGTISEQDKAKLIYNINIGLTELYTRFPLLTRELTIIQKEGKTAYTIDKRHAVSDKASANYDKYIIDNDANPFLDDLVRILNVYDEEGNEIRVNDATSGCSVFTPAVNILEVPIPIDTNALFVIYQAKHYELTTYTDEIKLPHQFVPALLAYVAYRVYQGGSAQEHINLANMMQQRYELYCTQQREYGTDNSAEHDHNVKPCLGGWI